MKSSKFTPVAKFRGNLIHAPEDGFISFFNSPFYSHKNMTGIDIFPGDLTYSEALSPVRGTVKEIRSFRGHSTLPNVSKLEYLILVQNDDDPSVYTKILHVKPAHSLSQGKHIDIGDKIGEYIRSFFFARWTDPHLHCELRPKDDTVRARGALRLNLCFSPAKEYRKISETPLEAKLVKYTPNALFLEVNEEAFSKKNLIGLKVSIEKMGEKSSFSGIIDAGIPHFGHGGIFTEDANNISQGDIVKVNGIAIGKIFETDPFNKFVRFHPYSFHIRWKDMAFKGISCRLSLKNRFIKIITKSTNSFQYQIGDFDIVKFII
ncbi:MAG: hypothetical protein ACFFA5_05835 [Promethearchaeota archaeon]